VLHSKFESVKVSGSVKIGTLLKFAGAIYRLKFCEFSLNLRLLVIQIKSVVALQM